MTSTRYYIYRFFCYLVPLVLLEIPTGIVADIWSRKNFVLIGTVLHGACFAVWIFANGFFLFAVGSSFGVCPRR